MFGRAECTPHFRNKMEKRLCALKSKKCFYLDSYDSYGLIMSGQMRFGLTRFLHFIRPSNLPDVLFQPKFVKYFEIEKYLKIIYYLTDQGIHRIYYDNDWNIDNKRTDIFIEDSSIIGFRLERKELYMFYFNQEALTVIDLQTRIRKTILKMDDENKMIYFMKINSVLG